ncbi:MAG TPA: hypothetical protein VIN71_07275 [Pseudomonadales bacterium]
MNTLKKTALGLAFAAALPAIAATDGTLGNPSTGDIAITLTIDDLVQISRLNDITFGAYAGSGNLTATEAFCVYRNGTGLYQVTLTGDSDGLGGPGTDFFVTSGANVLPYTVDYDDGSGALAVTSATPVTTRQGHQTLPDCGVADNTSLTVTLLEADLQAAVAGAYAGTLTLVVAPE